MSVRDVLAETAEWPVQEEDTSAAGSRHYRWSNLEGIGGIEWIGEGSSHSVRHVVAAETVLVNIRPSWPGSLVTNWLSEPGFGETTLPGQLHGSTVTFMPAEYRLLNAILHAPDDIRQRCLHLLGSVVTESLSDQVTAERPGDAAWLGADADAQVMPRLGEQVTSADQGLVASATSYRREDVALRVPLEEDE